MLKSCAANFLLVFYAILASSQCQAAVSVEETQLVLLQVLFRHGDRSPIAPYPGDPYNESTWASYGGFGQLTQIGMKQTHQYGCFLRRTYSKFLTERYEPTRVFVRSTDYDRTIISAQSVLAGLFEPRGDQLWNEQIKWQPIPIHTKNYENVMIFSF
jgi:lysosomal acid phosphatase